MSGKFMKISKLVIEAMTLVILISQITGCASATSKEMIDMINKGQTVTIETAVPNYQVLEVKGIQQATTEWTQLDQLKTYNDGFRQAFDETFNINIVTEKGINGKSGCLYVDEAGDRYGNTTIEDAFRNKVFVNNYWGSDKVKNKLAEISHQAYTDVDKDGTQPLMASLNAYFNLLPDAKDPKAFNGTQPLTREGFYTLMFRATEGVSALENDKAFDDAIGGATENSKYAQGVAKYGWLDPSNKSLDKTAYNTKITKAEAIYMLVNANFSEELSKVTGKEKPFKDIKNGGDLALEIGFKEKNKETKEIVGKDRWQAYTLAYMSTTNNKSMPEELYKAMVVAKNVGLIKTNEARWDDQISRTDAIQMIIDTQLAKNKIYGYLSEVEYGKINLDKFDIESAVKKVDGIDEQGNKYGEGWTEADKNQMPPDPQKQLSSGITMWQARIMLEDALNSSRVEGADRIELGESICKDFGTTYRELTRLSIETAKQAEKEYDAKGYQQTHPTQPSTGGSSGDSSGGSSSGSSGGSSGGGSSYTPAPAPAPVPSTGGDMNDWLRQAGSDVPGDGYTDMDDDEINLGTP